MQSLEPHDPRRLFLDTLKAPDEQRCAEIESNAVLVDRAVTEREKCEQGAFSLRCSLLQVVRDTLEENYLTTLRTAKLAQQLRRFVKNNGMGSDPEGGALRKMIKEVSVSALRGYLGLPILQ